MHGSGAAWQRLIDVIRFNGVAVWSATYINGVPVWNGDISTLRDYETAALWFRAGLTPGEQERAVARLWANLQGPAKEVVRMCKPQDFEDAREVERLLRILRESPLA